MAIATGSARADEGPTRTLELFPPGVEHCYAGHFDAAYRKARPGQIVTEFLIYRSFQPKPAKEIVELPTDEQIKLNKDEGSTPWVSVLAKLEGEPHYYEQAPSCYDSEEKGDVFCGVDCDGGSFRVKKAPSGLTVSFEEGGGLSLNQSCGDPDEEGHGHGLTDREAGHSFNLVSRPPAECIAADAEARPAFAADPVPLRERIAREGWRCLSRVYDAAHLKQHPKQKVAGIALAISGPAKAVREDYNWMTTTLEVKLSVRLRDGKTVTKPITCTADEYQFRCADEFRLRRRDGESALLLARLHGGEDGAAQPLVLNGMALGEDDKVFKLNASSTGTCTLE